MHQEGQCIIIITILLYIITIEISGNTDLNIK